MNSHTSKHQALLYIVAVEQLMEQDFKINILTNTPTIAAKLSTPNNTTLYLFRGKLALCCHT